MIFFLAKCHAKFKTHVVFPTPPLNALTAIDVIRGGRDGSEEVLGLLIDDILDDCDCSIYSTFTTRFEYSSLALASKVYIFVPKCKMRKCDHAPEMARP